MISVVQRWKRGSFVYNYHTSGSIISVRWRYSQGIYRRRLTSAIPPCQPQLGDTTLPCSTSTKGQYEYGASQNAGPSGSILLFVQSRRRPSEFPTLNTFQPVHHVVIRDQWECSLDQSAGQGNGYYQNQPIHPTPFDPTRLFLPRLGLTLFSHDAGIITEYALSGPAPPPEVRVMRTCENRVDGPGTGYIIV